MIQRLLLVLLPVCAFTSCGYHVAGKADLLPKDIQTIAIPAFGNVSVRYKLADRLPSALTREFIARTRYHIVADPGEADATLSGVLVSYQAFPVVFDQATGRATGMQIAVMLQLSLTDRNGTVLFTRPSLDFRERYEISVSENAYFEENEVAMERLSRDVARTIVSSVLEMF